MTNKRIAFVIGSMGNGGAERVVSIIANEYARQGWQVDILMLLSSACTYILEPNIALIDLSGKCSSRIARLPYWLTKIRKYAHENRPDIIVSFVARINIITKLSLINIDIPIIVSERNDPYMDGRGLIVRYLTKKLYPLASAVVLQTRRAQGYFCSLKNSIIISNPIEVHASKSEMAKNRIVSIGRLSEQKNQKMLIDAFAKIHQKYPKYTLDIYGEGSLRSTLQKQIESLNLDSCVTLRGAVSDVHQQIADAKLFVLSSDYEGLSNALLEAMMMGLPCISTNCAGSDEYIEHLKNGLLVDVGDTNAMATAIEYMISHPSEAKQMGTCAKHKSQSFEKNNVIKQWTNIINTSISKS